MGEAVLDPQAQLLTIYAHFVFYGGAAEAALCRQQAAEAEALWNEPGATVEIGGRQLQLRFSISSACAPQLDEYTVLSNTDPRNNFFRIEEEVQGNISFVDGLGSNTGFFKRDNLLPGWTTTAHEFGHTLGLPHPPDLDLRGKGRPGIMYPRGTLVDAMYQYDPGKPAGATGGSMHPMHRRVLPADIAALRLHRLRFRDGRAIVGDFTNRYHWPHF